MEVVFVKMCKEDNIELVRDFFLMEDRELPVFSYVLEYFPKLKEIRRDEWSLEEISRKVREIVEEVYDGEESKIDEEIKRYSEMWKEFNDGYFKSIQNYLNIKVTDMDVVEAMVGVVPVFARFLDTNSFCLAMGLDKGKVVETVAHEVLHFVWFRKWMELYPETRREEMESPFMPWKYSEMVTDCVLNSEELQGVFQGCFVERAYEYFYALEDEGKLVMDKLKAIFMKEMRIEEKIEDGYRYVEGYFDERV